MSKDPAFLFYSQDFLVGTALMTNEETGIYIKLLCIQHQHGGLINKTSFNVMVKDNILIKDKFIETEDGYFNQRLTKEMVKREKKCSNLSENAIKRWEKHANAMQMQCKCIKKQLNSDAIAMQAEIENEINNKELNKLTKDNENIIHSIILYLNNKTGFHYRATISNTEQVRCRLEEGYTKEEIEKVIDLKCSEWLNDEKMKKYLRPKTLFNKTNFNNYAGNINQSQTAKVQLI